MSISDTLNEGSFKSFGKIERHKEGPRCTITEKIDGTNAQIVIKDGVITHIGSRKRWITPGKATDNYGFAQWVTDNSDELVKLGDGVHFGEWFGNGIQHGYGLDEKRLALFNVKHFTTKYCAYLYNGSDSVDEWPDLGTRLCVVPFLSTYSYSPELIKRWMRQLNHRGSVLVPGQKSEGIIISVFGTLLKATFENPEGKWKFEEAKEQAL